MVYIEMPPLLLFPLSDACPIYICLKIVTRSVFNLVLIEGVNYYDKVYVCSTTKAEHESSWTLIQFDA